MRRLALLLALTVALGPLAQAGTLLLLGAGTGAPAASGAATLTFNWANNAYNQAPGTTASVSRGANTIANTNYLAAYICTTNATTDPGIITAPAGWSASRAGGWFKASDSNGERCNLFDKIASGGETGPYSFTWTNSNVYSWLLVDYTATGTPAVDAVGDTQHISGYGTAVTAPSISPTGSADMLLAFFSVLTSGTTTCSTSCTLTMRVNQTATASSSPWLGMGELQLAASGATATQRITLSDSNDQWEAIEMAVTP